MDKTDIENFKALIAIKGVEERVIEIIKDRYPSMDYYLNNSSPKWYFDNLGCWSGFIEGHDFWFDLHEEWRSLIDSGISLEHPLPNLKSIW